MNVRLPYGKTELTLQLPDNLDVTVVEPVFTPGLPDPAAALRQALQQPIGSAPLRDLAQPGERVGIIFNDITRPTPNELLLPALLSELSSIPRQNITLFNALGTHRPNTEAELRGMLGDELVDGYRIVQNNSFNQDTQVQIGTTRRGHPIWINRELWQCDLKILTGFIEPHFFAGFSGGGKAIMPGMAGQATIFGNHSAAMIGDPHATWGVTWGNPIWEEVREVAHQCGRTFLLNVTLNKHKQITAIFCGDLDQAHQQGCAAAQRVSTVAIEQPFDIVITTNSGYPLDLNLYQTVKGMSAAAEAVRPGGAILIAAECWDGIPEHGLFADLLRSHTHPRNLLDEIHSFDPVRQDQWQAQVQTQIQLKADVYVHSGGLSDDQIRACLLKPAPDLQNTLAELLQQYGLRARICVLPEGPQTIPYRPTK